MHARPRAKINLTLAVGPRGRDGYHPLASLFLRIGLSDELTVAFSEGGGVDALTVSGVGPDTMRGNLVLRAFAVGRRLLGANMPSLVAHLDKRIPIGGGLGGGSSDAATALDSALQMWGAAFSPQMWQDAALELGADVPFFAANSDLAWVTGRGEHVDRQDIWPRDFGVLLVTPPFALSTAEVFARFDELGRGRELPNRPVDAHELVASPRDFRDSNGLWPAAASLEPRLDGLRDVLEKATLQPWLMSGSGSTLFALYPSPAAAAEAGRSLVAAELEELGGATINAVDLAGPEPVWRYPWPSEQ